MILLISGGASAAITLGLALYFFLSAAPPPSPPPLSITAVPPPPVASIPRVSPPPVIPPPAPPPSAPPAPQKPRRKLTPQEWLYARLATPKGRESREWCMAQELVRRPEAARSYRITLHFNERLEAERDKSRFDPAPSEALRNCLHHHLEYKAYDAMREAMGDAPERGPVGVTVSLRFPNVKPAEKPDDRFR